MLIWTEAMDTSIQDDFATQGERALAILSWGDPRTTANGYCDYHLGVLGCGCVPICDSIPVPGGCCACWALLASTSEVAKQDALCTCQFFQEIASQIRCAAMALK